MVNIKAIRRGLAWSWSLFSSLNRTTSKWFYDSFLNFKYILCEAKMERKWYQGFLKLNEISTWSHLNKQEPASPYIYIFFYLHTMNDISINRSDSKDKSSCVPLPGSHIVSTPEDYGWDKGRANTVPWKANSHGNRWWPWRSCSELTLYNYWFEAGDAFILKVIT